MGNMANIQKCENSTIGNENNVSADDKFNERIMNIVSVPLYAILLLIVISLGCTVDLKKLWCHFKRPWGLAVGLVCQFALMPLIAFTLATSFHLKYAPAIAVLVMGSCPGGILSNVMSYWTDGDMDLSIFMTVFSTILATGLMPLNLFIYSPLLTQGVNDTRILCMIEVPYKHIGIALVSLIIPLLFGIFITRKWPNLSKILLKAGATVGSVLFLIISVTTSVLYRGPWNADPSLLIIGAINPLIGYAAGFIFAVIFQQSWKRCRTIAFETGTQNGHLCTTILLLAFKSGKRKSMFAYPFIYILFQIFHGLIFIAVFQIYKRCWKWGHGVTA
ncbi:sodium-dependent organic anion transporter-like [Narcine bancroftii]|uniref:sodium-dependent organic anion transporter-like n=1 Tax=Narcine bancroftii TaxID=1343680 RepID=UPI0038312202